MPKLVRYSSVLFAAALGLGIGAVLGLLLTALILGHGANVGEEALIIQVPACLTTALVGGVGMGFLARALPPTRSRGRS
ncbi:MAG TPA: hypothetical protein VHW01_17475 [Polyangiaceae bacterium]|nr:hypothetical protein [Polyangiaceae bacterium]